MRVQACSLEEMQMVCRHPLFTVESVPKALESALNAEPGKRFPTLLANALYLSPELSTKAKLFWLYLFHTSDPLTHKMTYNQQQLADILGYHPSIIKRNTIQLFCNSWLRIIQNTTQSEIVELQVGIPVHVFNNVSEWLEELTLPSIDNTSLTV